MATLTAWRFETSDGAATAAEIVRDLAAAQHLVLHDAALVEWEPGRRKPRTRQLGEGTGDGIGDGRGPGALSGGFWGLLFGLIFFVPLLGAAIGAATGAIAGSLSDVGIDDGFINRVRDQVTPGTSALFLLTSEEVTERVRDAFADGPHGDLISTGLSPEQESALREIFGD